MRAVPAGLDPDLKALLDDMRSAVVKLQQPGKPANLFAVDFAGLPPADLYKNCSCVVSDKNCLAASTLVGTSWTWLRADGSAL